jgi:AcrR family transcriptional regulator
MSKKPATLDPRVERTRTALVAAFTALSTKRRLTSISVKDVAAKAKVNRATFYAHFPDKSALLDYTVRGRFREQLGERVPADAALTLDTIERLVAAACNAMTMAGTPQCKHLHGEVEGMIESKLKEELRTVVLGLLQRTPRAGQEAGRDGVGLPMRATIATWAIYGAALDWRTTRDPRSGEAFAAAVGPTIARVLNI